MLINLKKLLRRQNVQELLRECAGGGTFSILDHQGDLVHGLPPATGEGQESIFLENSRIGQVSGSGNSRMLATLLSFLAQAEHEKRMLVRETLNCYKEIAFFYGFTEKIASCLDCRDVARLVAEEAMRLIRAERILVRLVNEETGELEIIATIESAPGIETISREEEWFTAEVMASGRPDIGNDILSGWDSPPEETTVRSFMCAPLKVQDRIIGVINLGHGQAVDYSSDDLKLFTALAVQAATAIENARLYEKLLFEEGNDAEDPDR